MEFESFLYIANFLGIISFAASGVFKGIKHNHDIVGVTFLAMVTATGGGIIRDVLLNEFPSALQNVSDIYLSIITSLVIYIPYLIFKGKILSKMETKKELTETIRYFVLISDAIGLSLFIYIGANIGITHNLNTLGVVMMATITSIGGGIIRDLLANETPIVLKEDVYAILCVIGGYLYKVLIVDFQISRINVVMTLFFLVLIIRLVVIFKKLNLPK